MVGNLSPEPPSNFNQLDEEINPNNIAANFIIQDSDEDNGGDAHNGYQLLSQIEMETDDAEDGEEHGDNGYGEYVNTSEDSQNENNAAQSPRNSSEEILETLNLYRSTTSTDIDINEEEIRNVMSNINLPSSAIPSWARSLPDSQLNNLLTTHIQTLQQR